jgi:YesN/AraC family two-component response regulator
MLKDCGYTVLVAQNGNEAIEIVRNNCGPIHLLVTDVIMPCMGGKQLAEQLAAIQPGLRVLYVSGYTASAIAHHGVPHPDTAFLHKPFSAAALAQKDREVLDQTG